MTDFAKLFRVGEQQLLVFMEPDSDSADDGILLHQMIDVNGLVIDLKMRGSENAIEAVFARLGQEEAENFFKIDVIKSLLESAQ